MADSDGRRQPSAAQAAKEGNRVWRAITSDRGARWTSWLVILVVWQIAGQVSEKFPTPVGTVEHLVEEFQAPYHGPMECLEQRARAEHRGQPVARVGGSDLCDL